MTKIVLTSGPSSGKSTLVRLLSEKGFAIIPEVAEDLLRERGLVDRENKLEYTKLQNDIATEQVRRENEIYFGGLTFLDRGIYDGIAYCEKHLGFIPEIVKKLLDEHKGYDKVFLLEKLPFVKESYRIEKDEEEQIEMHNRIIRIYENLGYKLERIPVLESADKRLEYLLERVK